jgi:predicted peptidase
MALPGAIDSLEASGAIEESNRFFMLAPLCPMGTEWKTRHMADALLELIEGICSKVNIDRARIYLTGVSMGGLGSWMLGARAPAGTFAAISPMCGGGQPLYARLLTKIPMWFFHSAEDNVVGVEETEAIYAALLKESQGSKKIAHFTRYSSCPEPSSQEWMVGHNCWGRTYRNKEFWKWMFSQRCELRSNHT